MIVDTTKLAEIVGVNRQTITAWLRQGMPVHERRAGFGQPNKYDTTEVFRWYAERHIQKAIEKAGELNKGKQDARLKKAKARRAELELQKMEGELVPLEEVQQEYATRIIYCKTRLLQIPRAVGKQSRTEQGDDLERWCQDEIEQALTELSRAHAESFKDPDEVKH